VLEAVATLDIGTRDQRMAEPVFPSERRSPDTDATRVATIDLSPDGTRLVSGSSDGEVALWDTASLTKLNVLSNGSTPIRKVKFSPDGKLVAATNDWNELLFLRTGGRKERGFLGRFFGGSTKPTSAAEGWLDVTFSADGRRVAAAAKESVVRVLDVNPLKAIKSLRGDKVVALSPKGDLLASANMVQTMDEEYMEVTVVSVDSGTGRVVTREKSWVNALAFSPDGKFLACALQEGLGLGNRSHHVAVWSLPECVRLPNEIKHDRGDLMDYITGVLFTPSGTHMVSACIDGSVAVWRVGSFDRVQTLVWQEKKLTCLAATDSHIAVVSDDSGFCVWG